MSSFDLGRAKAGSAAYGGHSYFEERVLPLTSARLVADGTVLTNSSAPAYILSTGTMGRIRWAANAAVTAEIEFDCTLPGSYMTNQPARADEVRFLLTMKSAASGTDPGQFTPTLFYQRAGSAVSSAVALSAYKKGLTLDALDSADFADSATFTLTDEPTHPEVVMLQFRGNELQPFDSLRLQLTPSQSDNNSVDLFSVTMHARCYAGMARFRA